MGAFVFGRKVANKSQITNNGMLNYFVGWVFCVGMGDGGGGAY
jgi:hypothetical protein